VTLANDPALSRIEDAIQSEQLADQPGVLISYLLLTEWATVDGDVYLVESRPEAQAYWRTLGLIEAARMSVDHGVQYHEGSEE
jgi:hypothetical protein